MHPVWLGQVYNSWGGSSSSAPTAIHLRNPERVRRYALHDVEEVDGLSRALMGATFMLASMVPRPYEKIATIRRRMP
jgi:hypothetical protein